MGDFSKSNNFNYGPTKYTIRYKDRYEESFVSQTVDETLNKLHDLHLDMIDELVSRSDLADAKEVIASIMQK